MFRTSSLGHMDTYGTRAINLGPHKSYDHGLSVSSKMQGSSTRNLRYSTPNPQEKKQNHLMHSLWLGLGVALASRYLLKNDNETSVVLAVLATGGSYWWMSKYGMRIPHYSYDGVVKE